MNLFRLVRFFLPLQNPVGFTLPDFIAAGVAIVSSRLVPRMLLDIQNRGQLSAGISSFNPARSSLLSTYKELGGVSEEQARVTLARVAHKMPVTCRFVTRRPTL